MPHDPEAKLKSDIRKYLNSKKIYWASIQNGFGAKPGDPDLVLCVCGRFIALEVKAPEGRQSEIQRMREKQIRDNDGWYFVVRSLDQVKSLMESLMVCDK